MNEFRTGDRVRIVLETEVVGKRREGRTIYVKANGDDELWFDLDQDDITIEKLPPPVVTFKPGDRLRRKGYGAFAYEITLADEGYLQHFAASGVEYNSYNSYSGTGREFFNSDNFDLVKLYEPPL